MIVLTSKGPQEPASGPGASSKDTGTASSRSLQLDPWNVLSLSEAEKLSAIECFLGLEGDLRPASISGATRLEVSQIFAPADVELAALYAISYIYYGKYNHADAIALRGEGASISDASGQYSTKPAAIHKAYRYYRRWFPEVRKLGLSRAENMHIRPLDGSGLEWY